MLWRGQLCGHDERHADRDCDLRDRRRAAWRSAWQPSRRGNATAPDTKIDGAKIKAAKGRASFTFSASGGTGQLEFQCALARGKAAPSFSGCSSPKSYKRLKKGRYTFSVRALDGSGRDGSAATKTFKSKLKKR